MMQQCQKGRKNSFIFMGLIALGTVLLLTRVGRAQEPSAPAETSFSIQLFQPSPGSMNFFSVESPELGDDWLPSIGFMLTYQHRPLVLLACTDDDECSDGADTIEAVKNFGSIDILGSFNFLKYFQVGLAVPMQIMHGTGFLDLGDHAAAGDDYTSFVVSDIRLHLKARFVGKDGEDGPSLAVAVIPTLPLAEWTGLGQSDDVTEDGAYGYGGEGFLTVTAPKVMFGYRVGPVRFGISAGALWRKESQILSTEVGPALTYGGAIGYSIIPAIEILAELYGHKLLTSDNFTDTESAPLLFLGGGRFTAGDVIFNLGAGGGILSGIGVPQFQVIAGMAWAPKREEAEPEVKLNEWDIDSDGIDNKTDKCPDKPEDPDGFQDEDGCPDEDNDGDKIADGYDSCPMDPEDMDNFRDDDGCPDLDHDEDGIKGDADKCPDKAEDFDDFEDADGCPEEDNDKDGFIDGDDFCPDEAEDKDGFEDSDGCPDLDNDADGVPDNADKCPDQPETLNGFKDEDGCPDKGKALVVVTEEKIELKEMIRFKTGSDEIRGKQSFEILDIVANILFGNPVLRISVEGHTDDRGNAARNRDLSKRRADSVKAYLIEKGIQEDRLETVGFGPDKPIESNRTRKGRAANRRVEFIILSQRKTVIPPEGKAPAEEAPKEEGGEMDFTTNEEGGTMDFTGE